MDANALYGLPLEKFTEERTALARARRSQGDPEGAAAIAALRKPTLVAWTVNQLARCHPREVDLLLDASHRLIAAQTGATEQDDVARAVSRQREAIAGLVAHARGILGSRASAATLARVNETLRASSLTPDGRERLAQGTLERELTTTGWELLAPAPSSARTRGPKSPAGSQAARKKRVALARSAVKDARRRLAEQQRRLDRARTERSRLEQQLGAGQRAEEEAHDAVTAAEQALAAAESLLADAEA